MRIDISVHPKKATGEFADTALVLEGQDATASLDIQYGPILDTHGTVPAKGSDLVLVAASAYAIDKLVSRDDAPDRWTRQLEVTFPVSDPSLWEGAHDSLQACLRFLTGDLWHIGFQKLGGPTVRRSPDREDRLAVNPEPDAVSLFSGGLDSLVGILDWLETNPGKLTLVGHHDAHVPGPLSDQHRVYALLSNAYPGRTSLLQVRAGVSRKAAEHTYRSRSLLFLALGIQSALAAGPGVPLMMPENGAIALNAPLTPARRGSCSTRTAHPHFVRLIRATLARLGITNSVTTPLRDKTKGECLKECLNRDLLRETYPVAISCAKRGHPASWVRRNATQCGRCMPCIYRRAALHTLGWDTEIFGSDICTGEVHFDKSNDSASDLRAFLSFVRADMTERDVMKHLLANGNLSHEELKRGAAVVTRSMAEVATLMRDKGDAHLRRRIRG